MKLTMKLVPAAIALAFAGAAQAQVAVYGLIDMSYGKNEIVDGPNVKGDFHSGGDDGQSQGNSTTRIGVKGSLDAGSGYKANFKFETNGITSDGSVNDGNGNAAGNGFFNRQAWLGFSHAQYGEVRLGRQDSLPFQVMGQFDFNGQSNGVTSGYSGVAVWATDRQSRSLQYISPAMAGFKVQLGYVPEGEQANVGNESVVSGAVTYTLGDLMLGAAYESERVTNGEDFNSVAASYDFKVVKVMAGYTDGATAFSGIYDPGVLGLLPAPSVTPKGYTVGAVAPVAGFSIGTHYAKDTENEVSMIELFANREILKNTYGYAEYGRLKLDKAIPANQERDSFAVGVIYVF
jgi:predicted porin